MALTTASFSRRTQPPISPRSVIFIVVIIPRVFFLPKDIVSLLVGHLYLHTVPYLLSHHSSVDPSPILGLLCYVRFVFARLVDWLLHSIVWRPQHISVTCCPIIKCVDDPAATERVKDGVLIISISFTLAIMFERTDIGNSYIPATRISPSDHKQDCTQCGALHLLATVVVPYKCRTIGLRPFGVSRFM